MSIFNDKALKGVAEAAAKIMAETSHGTHPKTPKEKSLAALAHPKDKITHKDVLVGRGVLKKEEKEQLQEYESKDGKYTHKGTYGREKGAKYGESDYSKGGEEEKEAEKAMKSPKRASKGYGARQNMGMRGQSTGEKKKKVNESLSFTEMLELYNEHGLKVLAPIETEEMDIDGTTVEVIDADQVNGVVATAIEEEATEEEFNKEYEDQKASFEGKKKQPKVAAGKTVGVKNMPEEVEQIDELVNIFHSTSSGGQQKRYQKDSSAPEAAAHRKSAADAARAARAKGGGDRYQFNTGSEATTKKGGTVVAYKEETELDEEQLDELSKDTYKSYLGKTRSLQKAHHAGSQLSRYARTAGDRGYKEAGGVSNVQDRELNTANARKHAKKMLKQEEVELDERTLTPAETAKKEKIVKSMKKGLSGFKQRYGERAKEVMYATATKQAKKD